MASGVRTLAGVMALGAIALVACGDKQAPAAAPDAAAVAASSASGASLSPSAAASVATPAAIELTPSGQADRVAPPTVPPVERDGIRYSQAPDGRSLSFQQVGGVLEATEVATGKRLWSLPVYTRAADPKLEADVQWVFFKAMRFLPSGELLIENESGEQYLVDVHKQTSTRKPLP